MRVYPYYVVILLMIIVLCPATKAICQSKNSCKNFEALSVETSVEPSQRGAFKLILRFDDISLDDYAIMLSKENFEAKVSKNKQKDFDDLKPGQYTVYIVDKKGCSKQVNINIK